MTDATAAKTFACTVIAISFCCLWWYDLNSPRKLCANTYKQPKTIWIPMFDGLNTHTNLLTCTLQRWKNFLIVIPFVQFPFVQRLPIGVGDRIAWEMSCASAACVYVNLENVVRLLLLYYLCFGFVSDGNDGKTKKCLQLHAQTSTPLSHSEEKDIMWCE